MPVNLVSVKSSMSTLSLVISMILPAMAARLLLPPALGLRYQPPPQVESWGLLSTIHNTQMEEAAVSRVMTMIRVCIAELACVFMISALWCIGRDLHICVVFAWLRFACVGMALLWVTGVHTWRGSYRRKWISWCEMVLPTWVAKTIV